MERFPNLFMHTWECKERPQEEISPPIGKEEVLYCYGLAVEVYLQRKSWLQGDKQLIFLEDEPGMIASFLHHPLACEMLSNPNVHIELLEKKNVDAVTSRFPVKRIEVAGLSSKKGFKALRLKLLRKTALAHALYMDRRHGHQPFSNFLSNLPRLSQSFYVNKLKNAFFNVPAVVCGAGPSLEETIPTLRTLENKALLIAGGSTLAALSSQGILPHFGMAIDPNLEEYRRLKNSFAFEVPMLYSTRVHPGLFQTCNGPFGYMRSGIGGLLELWIEEELGLNEPLLGEHLSPETISVTGICIALAQFLGCSPILLNGIDLAYTKGARYASGVTHDVSLDLEAMDQEKSAADRILRKKGVFSAVRWIMESDSISHFAKKHPHTRFINTTSGGIGFSGIDFIPIEEASKDFRERPLREQVERKIKACPMPRCTEEIVTKQVAELKRSLTRLIDHLEVLAGERNGSSALAEVELQEEIATLYLFYDIRQILKPGPTFWKEWLRLARQYQKLYPFH